VSAAPGDASTRTLALDAVAKRTSEGFVVAANAESFDWDEIFAWLKEHAKGMSYFMVDDGGSVNAAFNGKCSRTFRLDALGPKEEREKKAKVLNVLLVKAEVNHQLEKIGIGQIGIELGCVELGKTPAEVAKDAGLDAAVIAGERPKVRGEPPPPAAGKKRGAAEPPEIEQPAQKAKRDELERE